MRADLRPTVHWISRDTLVPTVSYLGILCLAYYLLAPTGNELGESDMLRIANTLGPLSLALWMGWVACVTVKRSHAAIWTPYVLFSVNSAVFFGIGPLVYQLGSAETRYALSQGLWALTEHELLRANLLSAVGICSVLCGFLLSTRSSMLRSAPSVTRRPGLLSNPATVAVFFLVVGGLLHYGIWLPYEFGMSSYVVAGALSGLVATFNLGLALAAYLSASGRITWAGIFWFLWPLHVVTTTLTFAKYGLIIAIILPALGAYLAHRNGKRLFAWALFAALVFVLAQPMVHYGRQQIMRDTGTIHRATLSERLDILAGYIFQGGGSPSKEDPVHQRWWTRLCYAGSQTAAMRQYDRGNRNDDMDSAWRVLIPRIVWPDKPVIQPGADAYESITGHTGSNLGVTIYADAYWHRGWTGVVLFSLVAGLVFAVMTKLTLQWLSSGSLIYLPAVFLSLNIVLVGTTEALLSVFGNIVIYVAYVVSIGLVASVRTAKYRGRRTARWDRVQTHRWQSGYPVCSAELTRSLGRS